MKTQRSADIYIGGFLIILGSVALYAASKITGGLEERLPPRALPYTVSLLTIITGTLLAVRAWSFRGENPAIKWPNRKSVRKITLSLVALVAYIGLMEPIGLPLSTFLYISFSVWYLGRYRILLALFLGLVSGWASYLIFIYFLGLTFPVGPFLIR